MRIETVAQLSADLFEYYGKPLPSDRSVELWHAALAEIPDIAATDIFSRITEEHDFLPSNIPKTIKDLHLNRGKYLNYGPQYREVILD